MADHIVKILKITPVTHDVHTFLVEKPEGYSYTPGQATDLNIEKDNWREELRPFTFTSLTSDETLEFTIKSYTDHEGVTNELTHLVPGDAFGISDAWGAIEYKGEGIFLAGGAGITPFIAILRDLHQKGAVGKNRLFFANKTAADIIHHDEFSEILGEGLTHVLSREQKPGHLHGRIDADFLKAHISDFSVPFYVCGPDAFTDSILKALESLGASADSLVFEK